MPPRQTSLQLYLHVIVNWS